MVLARVRPLAAHSAGVREHLRETAGSDDLIPVVSHLDFDPKRSAHGVDVPFQSVEPNSIEIAALDVRDPGLSDSETVGDLVL